MLKVQTPPYETELRGEQRIPMSYEEFLALEGEHQHAEFPANLDWLNTDRPLTMAELRGKIVLLEFWTFC